MNHRSLISDYIFEYIYLGFIFRVYIFKSLSRLHRHSQGALVLHEEPQFAVKSDASWCTPVSLQNKSGAYYCTAGLYIQSGVNAAHRHAYVPVHAHCASFTACLVPFQFRHSKLQAS